MAEHKEIQIENEDEDITVTRSGAAGQDATEEAAGQPAADTYEEAAESGESGMETGAEERLQQELEAARQEARENLDKAVRAQAEMENLRKRTSRDVENAHRFALEKFVNELLPVLDSLELGLEAADSAGDGADSLREGMDLTLKKFRDVLEKFGVSVIDPRGEKFNPDRHEAVSMQEPEGSESGTVVSVMQKGYELNGRLIRPAMVIVAK